MAIKKNEIYSSLWASCDKLRGGMDASQYKDYNLTLLFVKYVTDKFKGVKYADITVPEGGSFDDMVALKGTKNIGEGMDKVIAKLAEAGNNQLRGVIDNAHFNDETKLGKGQEMVDKLTGLIAIFQRPEFDFRTNKTGGDDILGDAYVYLMRNFATESGKSKGQLSAGYDVTLEHNSRQNKEKACILFMQAFSLFQPCQTDTQICFLQNCLMSTAVKPGLFFFPSGDSNPGHAWGR